MNYLEKNWAPFPAKIIEQPGGGAIVTIGTIASPYANAAAARRELEAMEQRGHVKIERSTPSVETSC